MEKKQNFPRHKSSGKILVAALFILSGVLLFARNMGWITDELFGILVSWQSLLIILGIYSMVQRHYIGGSILLLVGVYFLAGGLSWLPEGSQAMIWPLALVLVGILFLAKSNQKRRWMHHHRGERMRMRGNFPPGGAPFTEEQPCESEDGFLHSDNTAGSVRHVMLDELFKGATIRTFFGGTVIDLRHTHIAPGETYIDVDCNWGGIELYIPTDWKVVTKCSAFFGGCEDKRWQGANVDKDRTLVIRGKLSFGGLVIKE
ncbi:MAG: cell wall-active antibiotics response protein [Bacteroides sp.]|nr:cell wall-active antibiotics response protein [Bacteroides sp.]